MPRKTKEEIDKLAPYLVGPDGNLCQEMVDVLMMSQLMECIRINFYDILDILVQSKHYKQAFKHSCNEFNRMLNDMLRKSYYYYGSLDNHSLFAELAIELNNAFDISENDIFTKYVLIEVLIEEVTADYNKATNVQNWDAVKSIPRLKSMFSKIKFHADKILIDLPSKESVYQIFDAGTDNLRHEESWLYSYFSTDCEEFNNPRTIN